MKTLWQKMVEETKRFVESIEQHSRVALICDSDPDGNGSAVIATHAIQRMCGVNPYIVIPSGHNVDIIDDNLVKLFREKKITHLITTDLAVDQRKNHLKRIAKFCSILILDHHKLYNDVTSSNILLVKPQLFQKAIDPSQYCTAKLAYDIFGAITDVSSDDWIAVIGILADSNFRTWKPFVKKTLGRLGLKLTENPFDNPLGSICNLMAYYEIYAQGKVKRIYDALVIAQNYTHALNSEIRKAEVVNNEVEYYLKNYKRFSETHDELLLIRIKPHYKIGSIVATRLSHHMPHTTIVIAQEKSGRMYVSARRQDFKVAVNDLLEQGVKELKESSAGGHIPAAGARFPKTQYGTFSARIIKQTKRKK